MVLALLIPLLVTADAAWSKVDDSDGILIESRPVAGSKYAELRLTATAGRPPEELCTAAFGTGQLDPNSPEVKSRQVLEQTADMRVVYDQVSAPFVSDRDYAVRLRRVHSANACEVFFEIANDKAPPLKSGSVRIEEISAHWRFEAAGGKTQIIYTLHSDPGGSLPVFLVESSAKKNAVRKLKVLLGS